MRFLSWARVQTDTENQKEVAGCLFLCSSCHRGDEWSQNQNLAEDIMLHRALHLCLIIFDWVSSCWFRSPCRTAVSAHKKPAVRIVSEHSGTSVQFPQMASFPKLPSSRPLAPGACAESIIRCVWAAPISATPVGGADIEWPFLHGSLILTQSLRLITTGTFHRVLDLINGFFPWLQFLLFPLPSFAPVPSCPAPLFLPAPEPITRHPQGPGLHNRVGSRPSYSNRIA